MRNQGDLAEGWYDPETKRKADDQARQYSRQSQEDHVQASDDDEVGPALPASAIDGTRSGPSIPSLHDLAYRDGMSPEGSRFYMMLTFNSRAC